MSHKGLALMGIGEASGDNAASDAVHMAIESPLLDNISIKGAKGVLVYFEFHSDCPMNALTNAMEIIYSVADEEADITTGTAEISDVAQDFVRVTVIATGFENYLEIF